MPVSFCLAPANEPEREVAAALLDQARRDGLLTGGELIITDKGFAGQEFEGIVASLDAQLIRPDRKDEPKRFGKLGAVRQWIESTVGRLRVRWSILGATRAAPQRLRPPVGNGTDPTATPRLHPSALGASRGLEPVSGPGTLDLCPCRLGRFGLVASLAAFAGAAYNPARPAEANLGGGARCVIGSERTPHTPTSPPRRRSS